MSKKAVLAWAGLGGIVVCLAILITWTTIKQQRYIYHYPDGLEAWSDSGGIYMISLDAGNNQTVPERYFLNAKGDARVVIANLDESYIMDHLKCLDVTDFTNSSGQGVRIFRRRALGIGIVEDRTTSFTVYAVDDDTGVAVGSTFSDQSSELPMEVNDLYRIFGKPSSVERVERRPWYHN